MLIKVVDDDEQQELYVFRVDLGFTLVSAEANLPVAPQGGQSPSEAMEVDDSDISTVSSSSSINSAAFSSVADEVEMTTSMQQLVDVASSRACEEGSAHNVADDESEVTVATSESEDGDDVPSMAPRRSDRQSRRIEHSPHHSSSSSRPKRNRLSVLPCAHIKKLKRHRDVASRGDQPDDTGDKSNESDESETQIIALINQLRESYDRRSKEVLDADTSSPSKVLELVRQVLAQPGPSESQSQDDSLLGQCAVRVTRLITASSAQKMVGYYLRSVLAHHLKQSSKRQYSRLARQVLGIKSSTDIAAYPAFFDFVQRHCPSIAAATAQGEMTEETMAEWLREPLFIADISWTEWRRYLSKSHLHITEAAVQRFLNTIESFKDWMQLGWVEIYDDEELGGQDVRARRDVHMPASKAKEAQRDVAVSISVVAVDLHCAGSECVLDQDAAREVDSMYLVQLDKRRVFDARHHWIGKINHLPDRLCNLKLTGAGKLVQTREIAAGEALTFDYGVDYWVYQLSGLELSEWCAGSSVVCSRGTQDLFRRMHHNVQDYTALPSHWVQRRSFLSSELERETWMGDLAEYLQVRSW